MKIKKTLTGKEVEIDMQEINHLYFQTPLHARIGLVTWIRENFGLDLMPKLNKKEMK